MNRKWCYIFSLGLVMGVLLFNLLLIRHLEESLLLGNYMLREIPFIMEDTRGLFRYCLKIRLMPILYLVIFSMTPYYRLFSNGYVCVMGLLFGILMSFATYRWGILGIALCMVGMLPQFLLYVPAIVCLLNVCQIMQSAKMIKLCAILLGVVLVTITGVWLESYVNIIFLKSFLKVF